MTLQQLPKYGLIGTYLIPISKLGRKKISVRFTAVFHLDLDQKVLTNRHWHPRNDLSDFNVFHTSHFILSDENVL